MTDIRPPILYLVHRIPYPPNKGDKVRSFNILRQLSKRHRVFLGTFIDHPDDRAYVVRLKEWCEEIFAVDLNPVVQRIASMRALLSGEALSLPYYRDRGLADWVRATAQRERIRQAVAFSGPMAQYFDSLPLDHAIVDFCDVDSAKWSQYADDRPWPLSWLYRLEGARLLTFERKAAGAADRSLFVTEAEAALFQRAAPEVAQKVAVMQNGVDAHYFSPELGFDSPYASGGPVVLFTGAMDYWPNIDAVSWFAKCILPLVRARFGDVRFWIVGMNPAPAVLELAREGVIVTGTVPDVRPYLAHANVVVAPLRIARGIQNKVLEAMAMARPVVLSAAPAVGLAARDGQECLVADGEDAFADCVLQLLADADRGQAMGQAARECVLGNYSWQAHLSLLDELLQQGAAGNGQPDRAA